MSTIADQVEILKLVVAYTLVGAFIFTVVITCASLVGWVRFAVADQQRKLFGALIVEVVVICLGVFTNLLNLSPTQTVKTVQAPIVEKLEVEQKAVADLKAQERATGTALKEAQSATLDGLTPETAKRARDLLARSRAQGIDVRVISGYRSPEQQAALYARGRTTPGAIVTNARMTTHNTGMAFDILVFRNGVAEFNDQDDYRRVGEIGKSLGLVWGGDGRIPDLPHFEMPEAAAVVRAIRGPAPR